jgi:hypothetical protein
MTKSRGILPPRIPWTAAEDALLHAYAELNANGKAAGLLKKRLAALPKGADLPPQEYFSGLQTLVQILSQEGDKKSAQALLATAKTDVKGHEMEEKMIAFIDDPANDGPLFHSQA